MYNKSAKKGRRTKRIPTHVWRVLMRISVLNILILAAGFQLLMADPGIGQELEDIQITVELENEPLVSVFKTIEQKTDYLFAYRQAQVNDYRVNLEPGIRSLKNVLDTILAGTSLEYQVAENKIIVKRTLPVVPVSRITEWAPATLSNNLQRGTITGKVIDVQTGEPLPGANILIERTGIGVSANSNGKFSLNDIETGEYTLRASFIGYQQTEKEVTVRENETTTVNFELQVATSEIDEMVVVGYGSVRKEDLTGSVSSVSAEEISEINATNFEEALAGRAAGVLVKQNNGRPGEGIEINIRGVSSVLGYNQPLYVIDGVPIVTNPKFSNSYGGNATPREDPLASLNPNDIESIEILKDASATAIYGSRAASGVVMVTTKQGRKNQDPQVRFGYSMTIDRILEMYDVLTTEEYTKAITAAAKNSAGDSELKNDILNNPDFFGNTYTDWQDEITRTAYNQNMNFSVRGGTSNNTYAISANITDQDGIIMNSGYSRYNIRTNLHTDVTPFFKVGTNINYSYSKRTGDTGLFSIQNAISYRPDIPVRDENGDYATYKGGANPVSDLTTDREVLAQNLLGNIFGTLNFTPTLSFTSKLNISLFNNDSKNFIPPYVSGSEAVLKQTNSKYLTTTFDNTVEFKDTFNAHHNVDALLGASWQKSRDQYTNLQTEGYANYEYINNVSAADEIRGAGGGEAVSGLASYFGRLNYNYDERYYGTFTIRTDGSSKFGPNNKWGVFPSGALAWRVSNESFFDPVEWVDDLKLRVSYGKTGLANVPDFLFDTFFGVGNTYNNLNGVAPSALPNLGISWQSTPQLDVAVDYSILNSRVWGTIGFFTKNVEDMLMQRPVLPQTGFQSQYANVGKMENTGIEFDITADIIRSDNFLFRSSLNITSIRNEVTDLEGGYPFSYGSSSLVQEGQPLGSIQGYVIDGIFQSENEISQLNSASPTGLYQASATSPGDYRFRDLNGDGVITAQDQQVLGSVQPDFYGGWSTNFSYKGFDLSTLVQFTYGNAKYWEAAGLVEQEGNELSYYLDDPWSVDNPDGTDPRLVLHDPNNNTRDSNAFIHDASYIRLKNISLGYTVPTELTSKIKISNVRIYGSMSNLLTITDYPGLDPETSRDDGRHSFYNYTDADEYPLARSIVFGIEVGLQ